MTSPAEIAELVKALQAAISGDNRYQMIGSIGSTIRRAAAALEEVGRDRVRLNHIEKTLHIDATRDEPIYALYIPGTEGVKSNSDLRGLIDESIAISAEGK